METSTRLQENISALVDDALPPCEVELTLAALAVPEGRLAWQLYHLIGEVLRTDAPAGDVSPGFAARLAAQLAIEELPGQPGDSAPPPQQQAQPQVLSPSPAQPVPQRRDDNASPAAVALP